MEKGGILRKRKMYIRAVDGVNLTIYKGECLGLVGSLDVERLLLARLS